MSEPQIQKVSRSIEIVQTKLKEQTWIDTQDKEFTEALRVVDLAVTELSLNLATLVDFVTQHFNAVRSLPLFAAGDVPTDDNVSTLPTQTAGNRATRRAKRK